MVWCGRIVVELDWKNEVGLRRSRVVVEVGWW